MTELSRQKNDSVFCIDREKAKRAFIEYTEKYNIADEKIRLKVEHTYRVADLCETIAVSAGLGENEIDLAWLIGMLHDVGRFEQVRRYGTFNDAASIDHAACGADVLFLEGKIRDYISDCGEDKLMEHAVRCHSAYRIPVEYDDRTTLYANVLRDADKIDILKVNSDIGLEEIYNVTPEETLQSVVSDAVMESFWEEHATPRSFHKTPVDHLVGHVSLVYEMVFPISRKLVREQGYLQKLMNFESGNQKTRDQLKLVRTHMNAYLDR